MPQLGIDIGGANLKLADGEGHAEEVAFALWREPDRLESELRKLIAGMPAGVGLAVTMTGELADCFISKEEGVRSILTAVRRAADNRELSVYTVQGTFVTPEIATQETASVASANWHALATFAARFVSASCGLVIDVGSTTTDIIPIRDRAVDASGTTDISRLAAGELVYTGVRRTPVCAIAGSAPWREHRQVPLAAEVFATSWDVYLTLGELDDEPANANTADGRPATRAAARGRLARMICADETCFDDDDAMHMAEAVEKAQLGKIGVAAQQVLRRMPQSPDTIVICGAGEFLARKLLKKLRLSCEVVSLAERFNDRVSQSACAHAVSVLAAEADE